MIGDYEEIQRIKELLQKNPQGLSITEISRELHLHRTTTSKYLDTLQMKGDVNLRIMGTSKIYQLSQRIPAAVIRQFHNGAYILISSRLTIRELSDEIEELFDIKEDIIGRSISDKSLEYLMSGDMPEKCKDAVFGSPSSAEITINSRKKPRHLSIRIIPAVFDDGRAGCSLLITDHTEYYQTIREAALCSKELKAVSDDLTEYMFRSSPGGILQRVNRPFCIRMNRNPEELIGFPYEPLISHEDLGLLTRMKQEICQESPVRIISFKVIQPDGMVAWEEWTYRGIFSEEGSLAGFLAVGHDISRQQHLEEQLNTYHASFESLVKQRTREMRQANQDLMAEIARRERIERELLIIEAAFNNASDSIILFERSGKVWHANQTSLMLLGYDKKQMLEITIFTINPTITSEKWEAMWQEPDKESYISRTQSVHQRKDGSIIPVEISRTFINAGPITLFCSIAREVPGIGSSRDE
ncbi:MAG: PAS domain S-box protein [Methanospirillum sp.]|nr:PAS domain S-box protein [Methanospirillum sp.]